MTVNTITLPTDFSYVYYVTANAALQRGDDRFVATSDDSKLLEEFLSDGVDVLIDALGVYYNGMVAETAGDKINYTMPANWAGTTTAVTNLANSLLNNFVLARWWNMCGVANGADEEVKRIAVEITNVLDKRTKPT